jgi:hypothetical protein
MKATPLLTLIVLIGLAACQPDGLLEGDPNDAFSPSLGDQPTLLKISYTEETQRKAEFPEGAAEKYGMTYLEEPKYEGDDCGGGNCYWTTETVTRTRWVNQPSDGFIKQSSQVGAESSWGGQAARLDGVNHLEMGVHPETNDMLRRAFEGRRGFNSFFQTSPR